jgi:uncharacterized protein
MYDEHSQIHHYMNTDQQPEDSSTPEEASASEPQAAPTPPPEAAANPTPPPAPASGLSKDSLNMGMLCHLLAFSGFIVPFGTILGPLIIWLVKKDSDPYVDEQGKESLNFQISMAIYGVVSGFLIFIAIGLLLLPVVIIGNIVLTIIGTIKASKGEPWKYPVTIRMIK